MVRFIHTGDLHLGLQFKNVSLHEEYAKNRRLELWDTFERIIGKAIKDETDFLFIAGDLFEEEYFTIGDIKRVRDNLAKACATNIVITAGNHDTLNKNSLYRRIDWPEHVSIFSSEGIDKKEFPCKNVVVYGYSWDTRENEMDILEGFPSIDSDRINILIVHGDVISGGGAYLPLDKNQLMDMGFDYIALGHIHKPTFFSNRMAYCGSPEPLDFSETGAHGIIEGIIRNGQTNIKFLPFSSRAFIEKSITIGEDMGYVEIVDRVRGLDTESQRKKNLYRIILDGMIGKDIDLNIEDMARELLEEFYYIELIDDTRIDYDLDLLEKINKDNIVGYFIEEMKGKDLEDKQVRDALYIGLDVLLKG